MRFFIPCQEVDLEMSPEEFEKECLTLLKSQFGQKLEYSIQHNVELPAPDGLYQIDVFLEFVCLGVKYKTIVECKRYKHSITREKVQILYQKVQSLGAQKGILISTSAFQSGAIKYATMHGLALIQYTDRVPVFITRSGLFDSKDVPPYPLKPVLQTSKNGMIINCTYLDNRDSKLVEYLLDQND